MIYVYEKCTGELITSEKELNWDELKVKDCDGCGDSHTPIGIIRDLNDIDDLLSLYYRFVGGGNNAFQQLLNIGVSKNTIVMILNRCIWDKYEEIADAKKTIRIVGNELKSIRKGSR
ncbi:hypothetical protein [Peptostreptococcus faecalis]|uniref:hypothetical protein n=1 Tax=Peptostreptococcus faecalis TaxID=2045015 RepID=UPI000C7B663B|nr:hypothetical protein [Peptostreptococcus faecalis]